MKTKKIIVHAKCSESVMPKSVKDHWDGSGHNIMYTGLVDDNPKITGWLNFTIMLKNRFGSNKTIRITVEAVDED